MRRRSPSILGDSVMSSSRGQRRKGSRLWAVAASVFSRTWAISVSVSTPSASPSKFRMTRWRRSEEHTSELQSPCNLVCRLLLEKKNLPFHAVQLASRVGARGALPGEVLDSGRAADGLQPGAGGPRLAPRPYRVRGPRRRTHALRV